MPKIDLGKVIGKDFKYENFTPEQLKALQIKGDAGDNKINVVKDGVKTREDLTLQQEGKFTKIVSGTSNSHKLLASDILTEDGNPIMDTVAQFSNPNLLINGDFKVWQRGTSFNGLLNTIYTADRWKVFYGGACSLKKCEEGMHFENNQSDLLSIRGLEMGQWLEGEDYNKLKGKVVTLSAKLKTENVTSGNISIGISHMSEGLLLKTFNAVDFNGGKTISVTLKLPNEGYNLRVFVGSYNSLKTPSVKDSEIINTGGKIIFEFIKFELGDVATPFVPRPYAEELVLCKRYYLKFGSGFVTFADFSVYDNRIEFLMHKSFRIAPTVKVTGGIVCYAIEGHVNMVYANPSVVASPDGYCCIVGTTIPYGKTGKIQTNGPGCLIEFDAEIY